MADDVRSAHEVASDAHVELNVMGEKETPSEETDSGRGSIRQTSSDQRNRSGAENDDEESEQIEQAGWDKFREMTRDEQLYSHEHCIGVSKKILKASMISVLFLVILGAMVVNKGSILFITSQINPHVAFGKQCQDTDSSCHCDCGMPHCQDGASCQLKHNVRWVWALVLCLVTPYVISFVRCLWKISFKKKRMPSWLTLLAVWCIETVHTIGMFLLLFWTLPYVDVSRGLFLTTAVAFVPSLLRLFREYNKYKYAFFCLDVTAMLCQLSALIVWPAEVGAVPRYYGPNDTSIEDVCPMHDVLYVTTTQNSEMVTQTLLENFTLSLGLHQGAVKVPTLPPIFRKATTSVPSITTSVPWQPLTALPESIGQLWAVPVALLLVSLAWWENFADEKSRLQKWFPRLHTLHKNMRRSRTKTYLFISLWKALLTFIAVLVTYDVNELFNSDNFHEHICDESQTGKYLYDWLIAYCIQAVPSLVCYYSVDLAVKANIQLPSFSVPIVLTTPVAYGLFLFSCLACQWWDIESDLYWNCFHGYNSYGDLYVERLVYVGILWWISQLWIVRHIWTPKIERLAKTDRIFVLPMYCGPLLDQSMSMNRRVKDREKRKSAKSKRKSLPKAYEPNEEVDLVFRRLDYDSPMIYICATMWHETDHEMIQMLKSVFRMDCDQKARKIVKEQLKIYDPDYYDLETHIFFDDAFELHGVDEEKDFTVNPFVKQLVGVIDQAASSVHNVNMRLEAPTGYITPYGGRLEWTLPGETKLFVHLKDKVKIRLRKRWSQVMYMYYLLGQRLMNQPVDRKKKKVVSENTYILALDGDVDFKPEAVTLLMDLMKRNSKVAAACGRIHPVGSGPMIWYQKFEYALGHWLQKATEHVLGCVLCSPGCFSLFRACALMEDNVMKTYSKIAVKAREFVQYNQGEDRWLCTLLLQKGYRVEYAAAADAMTHAPESFNEFYNQRKRWTPSTFANILDLLASARAIVRTNENVSMLYMAYQAGLLCSSILGPASIFLLMVGAFNMAFGVDIMVGVFLVFIPLLGFFILCMRAAQDTQLYAALILSAVFAIIQMVVLAGLFLEIAEYGLCSLSTIFVIFILGQVLLTGILHPQEFFNIFYGPMYYLCIPSIYLLLVIYSLCNLHLVTWGTREMAPSSAEKEKERQEELKKEAEELEKVKDKPGSWLSFLRRSAGNDDQRKTYGSHSCGCGGLYQCMCCLRPGESPEGEQLTLVQKQLVLVQNQLHTIQQKLDVVDGQSLELDASHQLLSLESDDDADEKSQLLPEQPVSCTATNVQPQLLLLPSGENSDVKEPTSEEQKPARGWIEDSDLGFGSVAKLNEDETSFWEQMINKYLEPLHVTKADKEDLFHRLLNLRNKAVFGFFFLDIMLIALVVVLQIAAVNGNEHRVSWSCPGSEGDEEKEYFLDPITMTFAFVFGIFMVIQLFGMLFHRIFSFMQIVSSTNLCDRKQSGLTNRSHNAEVTEARALVTDMMKLEGADAEYNTQTLASRNSTISFSSSNDEDADPDDTVHLSKVAVVDQITRHQPRIQKTIKLDQAFSYRFATRTTAAGLHSLQPCEDGTFSPGTKQARKRKGLPPEMRFSSADDASHTTPRQRERSRTQVEESHSTKMSKNKGTLFMEDEVTELSKKYNITVREKDRDRTSFLCDMNEAFVDMTMNSEEQGSYLEGATARGAPSVAESSAHGCREKDSRNKESQQVPAAWLTDSVEEAESGNTSSRTYANTAYDPDESSSDDDDEAGWTSKKSDMTSF